MLYSPNGAPLNGGPLGRPTCEEAMSRWFSRADINHDGVISHDEFMADARTQFQRMDIDKTGYLSSETLERFRRPYRQQTDQKEIPDPVMSADTDSDFKVTLNEFMIQAENTFTALDSSNKGTLSRDEITKSCAKLAK